MNKIIVVLCLISLAFNFKVFDSCNNFDGENGCRGNQTDNDPSWSNRSFQTPPRGDQLWR